MFDQSTLRAISSIAARYQVSPAALQAVAEIESAGKVFALVDGRNEPMIRFEGHYFDRRLTGAARDRARAEGLANPKAGAVKNPASQAARWRLLARALLIDAKAAYESVSWGLGQVMGAHWAWLGFKSVSEFVNTARSGAAGQVELMARFIENAGLVDELRRLDFNAFARGYNGPGYAANGYHTKMAAAYKRLSGAAPVSAATGMLRMGSEGAAVRSLQALLTRAGHVVKVDGDYGPTTRDAVKDFQRAQGITADGVAGPETRRRLDTYRQSPQEKPGALAPADVPEVRNGVVGGLTGGVGLEGASQAVQQAGDRLAWVPGLETVGAWLSLLALVLVLAGLAYAAWGWWKSRRTNEGDVAA